jgi:hypothetical protein|tara:strand:- start:842 stop:1072 length:231 start_codon:yes stop_codon:yes gene_type:complete
MGGVCEPPRRDWRAVAYLVVLVGYLGWLYVIDELGPMMAMGGRMAIQLAYYTLVVWAVFYALNSFLAVALERMHAE